MDLEQLYHAPDPDEVWNCMRMLFEERRAAFSAVGIEVSSSLNGLRDIVNDSVGEIRGLPAYSHVNRLKEIDRPLRFTDWVKGIEFERSPDDLKSFWKVESIWTIAEPVETAIEDLAKAYTAIKQLSAVRARQQQSSWSTQNNHRAMQVDLATQSERITKIFETYIQAFFVRIEEIDASLKEERAALGVSSTNAFERADAYGRLSIVAPLWSEVTEYTQIAVWESTWHANKMKVIRSYMRLELAGRVVKVVDEVRTTIQKLRWKLNGTSQPMDEQ